MAESKYQQKKPHTAAVWLAVLILVILLLLSFFWLAPLLLGASDGYWIPLVPEHSKEQSFPQSLFAEEDPGMVTYDDRVQWENRTEVDLFKPDYLGPGGSVTVHSEDGAKVIAPGTAHNYRFYLKNTGNISLDYTMELHSEFSLQGRRLPIRVRLRTGDRWVLGSAQTWANPEELDPVIEEGTLDANRSAEYIFEWLWPFEQDGKLGDLNDTFLGNAAAEQPVRFQLEIATLSAVTPGAVPPRKEAEPIPADQLQWGLWWALPWLLGIGLLLLLLWRRPIYVTGFAAPLPGGEIVIGRKKAEVLPDGRFVFKKIYTGTHKLTLGGTEQKLQLRRRRKVTGIVFTEKRDKLILTVHPSTRALELYLLTAGVGLTLRRDSWAVIDKKHRVITPLGVTEPKDKCNRTPGGLTVDAEGTLDIAAGAAVK